MYSQTRGGTRGGAAEFKWSDVGADKDRENYLGHSINAPTGRWQKNKDVHWYNRDKQATEAERLEEIRKVKEAEEEALSVALGFKPNVRPTSIDELGASSSSAPPKGDDQKEAERVAKAAEKEEKRRRKEEKRAKKEERRAMKDRRRLEDGRRPRSRSPSRSRSLSRSRTPPASRRYGPTHAERTGDRGYPRSRSRSPMRVRSRRQDYDPRDKERDHMDERERRERHASDSARWGR